MKPAALKTLRETLGLSSVWLTEQFNVNRRNVYYWESGQNSIPDNVISYLKDLDAYLWQKVDEQLNLHDKKYLPKSMILIRYKEDEALWELEPTFKSLPTTCHAVYLSRLATEYKKLGVDVDMVYMRLADYKKWLGKNDNTLELREKWAMEQEF